MSSFIVKTKRHTSHELFFHKYLTIFPSMAVDNNFAVLKRNISTSLELTSERD